MTRNDDTAFPEPIQPAPAPEATHAAPEAFNAIQPAPAASLPYFGVYYLPPDGSEAQLCEMDGGICYEAYRTIAAAQESADSSNSMYPGSYTVQPIPAGTIVYDRETETTVTAGISIREAWKTPIYCGGTPAEMLRIVWTYKAYRSRKPAGVALQAAKRAVSNGKNSHFGTGAGGIGSAFKVGSSLCRWIDSPEDNGLREAGRADSLCRSIRHTGWYLSEDNETGETAWGVVFRLPARKGESRFVAGYRTSYDDSGAAVCFESTEDETEAAQWSDHIAEIYAERERDYNTAWQAGSRFSDLGSDISAIRQDILALCKDIKESGRSFRSAVCKTLRESISSKLQEIDRLRRKRAELLDNYSHNDGFAAGQY